MGTIARMAVELGMDASGFESGIAKAQQQTESLVSKLGKAGATMSAAVTLPLAGVATMALKSAGDFESSMNVLQSVSGATAGDMQALTEQALRLGAETSFSAGEAADAMLELGKAGMGTKDIMGAMPGVLSLAAAGNMDVGQAAEIAANAINTFGLDATEAASVSNMLAAAANASSADVTDLAMGFKMAGSIFASNNQSMSDLTASMSLLANAGIAGSDAGTSLKTMLMRLAAPTDEAAAAMTSLGLNVYNSDGSMRDFEAIVGDLATSTAGLTDSQRNMALTTIFGADAIRAATILADAGADGFASMEAAVTRAGAAEEAAAARMKGLNGAMDYLQGSIDSVLITVGTPFLTMLGDMARYIADLVTSFAALPAPVQNAALAFAGVLAAAGPVMLAISGIGTALAFLLSPIGLVVAGVALLAAAWAANFGGIQEQTAATWAALQPTLTAIGDAINLVVSYLTATAETGDDRSAFGYIRKLPEFLQAPTLALGGFVAFVSNSLAAIQAGTFDWSAVIPPLDLSAMTAALSGIMTAFAGLWAWLQVALPAALTSMQTAWGAAWPAMQATWDSTWAVLSSAFATAQAWLATTLPTAITTLQAAWDGMIAGLAIVQTWFANTLPAAIATLQVAWDGLQALFSATPGAIATVTATFTSLWTQLSTIGTTLVAFFTPAFTRLGEVFVGVPESLAPLLPKLQEMGAAFGGLVTAVQPLLFALGVALAVAADFGINLMAAAMERLPGIVGPIIDQVSNTVRMISTVLTEVSAAVLAFAAGDWSAAWESMKSIVTAFQAFVSETWTNITTMVGNVGGAVGEAVVKTLEDMGLTAAAQAVKDIIAQIKVMGDSIAAVLSGDLAFSITLPDWLPKLLKWSWPAIFAVPSWITTLLAWAWPKMPSVPSWIQQLFNWRWPGLPEAPSWLADLLNWKWPAMPAFPGFPWGGGQADGGPVSARTTYLVGERGPELFTPNKSGAIIPNDELGGLWGDMAGAGEGAPQVTVYATVASQIDVHAMAYQVAAEIERWRRR